jgi:Mrp family chromosome partitioning ATPase
VPSVSWKLPTLKPISVPGAKSFQEGVREAIEASQRNLQPDEQLLVYYTNGVEMIRVGHVYMSLTNVAVISGSDQEGKATQVVAHLHALQLVCKVVKADENKKKTKIEFSIV